LNREIPEKDKKKNGVFSEYAIKLPILLFMTIFAQTLFALVRCHFMALTLFSTRHGILSNTVEQSIIYY
jgi:hypothetical protein